jgi:hypothetical protein
MNDTLYNPEIADVICRRIAEGESLRAICREAGMPSEGTVRGWNREDRDGFAGRYRLARELQLDYWADEIIDIADEANADPRCRHVRIDTRKWLMSKLGPRRYGERLLVAGETDSPLRVLHEQVSIEALAPDQLEAVAALAVAMMAKKGGG